jgi:hypothetical protein
MGQARFMNVRIGDAEREESVRLLAKHFGAGRLSPAEHEDRRVRAAAAIIRSEIEILFEDLPSPHPDMSAAQPPRPLPPEATPLSEGMAVMGCLVVVLGIPAAIILGFALGLWWLFAPVGAAVIGSFTASEMVKKKRLQD